MNIEIIKNLNGRKLESTIAFLKKLELGWEENPNVTINITEDDGIIATGSRHKNVFKCIGVNPCLQGAGLSSIIITELNKSAIADGYSHLFIYTKPMNAEIFKDLGFYTIAKTKYAALLENRKNGITGFIKGFNQPHMVGITGAVVANCNPFTNGHLYLVETAAKSCDFLYLFILSEDISEFSFETRFELAKKATGHINNIAVLPTGDYLVSSKTFPQYFLKDKADVDKAFCELDVEIFADYFAKELGITKRFAGTEPASRITNAYNEEMKNLLPCYGIAFIEIPRKKVGEKPVSASRVRKLLSEKRLAEIQPLVPPATFEELTKLSGENNA